MRLTRRGRIVVAVLLIAAAYALIQVSTNLWWVGDGYCWGSVEKCLLEGMEK
jgi:hypothetical protein